MFAFAMRLNLRLNGLIKLTNNKKSKHYSVEFPGLFTTSIYNIDLNVRNIKNSPIKYVHFILVKMAQ